jgi:hypothetical protein
MLAACRKDQLDIAKWLVEIGAVPSDIGCSESDDPTIINTALVAACEGGSLPLIQWLVLEQGCDPREQVRPFF